MLRIEQERGVDSSLIGGVGVNDVVGPGREKPVDSVLQGMHDEPVLDLADPYEIGAVTAVHLRDDKGEL